MNKVKIATWMASVMIVVGMASCEKDAESLTTQSGKSAGTLPVESTRVSIIDPKTLVGFTKYVIPKGSNYATSNPYTPLNITSYRFQAFFDSSAIYTLPAADQHDINKLSGFSDNGSLHQQFSARFGWRWSDQRLRLFGYVYNNGSMIEKEIAAVDIGKVYTCSIKFTASEYIFTIEELNAQAKLPRAAKTSSAKGYKLYPYFGGNNPAPHEVRIWLKNL